MALSATVRFKNSNWLECYRYHYLLLNQFTYTLLLGDSIIGGYSRYLKVWLRYFAPLKALNFGIGEDRVENVLWRTKNLLISPSLKNVVVRQQPFHRLSFGYSWLYCQHWLLFAWKVQEYQSFYLWVDPGRWELVRKYGFNQGRQYLLKYLCLKHDFSYIDQSNGWTLPNSDLDPSLFFRDSLHLVEEEMSRSLNWSLIL